MRNEHPALVACVSNADLQLTDLERELIAIVRSMADDARVCLVHMAGGIARGSPATRPQLTLAHSRAAGAIH